MLRDENGCNFKINSFHWLASLNHLFSVTTQHIKGVLKRLLAVPRVERNMNKWTTSTWTLYPVKSWMSILCFRLHWFKHSKGWYLPSSFQSSGFILGAGILKQSALFQAGEQESVYCLFMPCWCLTLLFDRWVTFHFINHSKSFLQVVQIF